MGPKFYFNFNSKVTFELLDKIKGSLTLNGIIYEIQPYMQQFTLIRPWALLMEPTVNPQFGFSAIGYRDFRALKFWLTHETDAAFPSKSILNFIINLILGRPDTVWPNMNDFKYLNTEFQNKKDDNLLKYFIFEDISFFSTEYTTSLSNAASWMIWYGPRQYYNCVKADTSSGFTGTFAPSCTLPTL